MATETKPCKICRTAIPSDGPSVCAEHGAAEQRDNDKRFATVSKPASNEDAGLMFWQQGAAQFSSYRTNHTAAFCRYCWFAHNGSAECPVCALPVGVRGDQLPPVLAATDEQMQAAGWQQEAPPVAVYEAEERRRERKKRGSEMASKKAKNGESNGEAKADGKNADPVKVINCTKTVRVRLTDAECRERGELAGAKKSERDALEEELDAHKKEQKGKIDALDAEIGTLLAQVYNGHESRSVRCRQEFHYRTNTVKVVREDTGDVLEERAMYPEEQQQHAQVPIQAQGANEETAKGDPDEKPKRQRRKRGEAQQEAPAGAE